MTPLAELVYHNFPNSLPEFVPSDKHEACCKLHDSCQYLAKQFSAFLSRPDAQANADARSILIRLEEQLHAEATREEALPETPEEAAAKLYSACRYLYKQSAESVRDAVANVESRALLIKLHDAILAENWQPFSGNLIDSLTEAVEKNEGAKPCRKRSER